MATRLEREKRQVQNDHYKNILAKLIAKEENKYCADCLAKGPRWASWNLGVLLCIRCSGIHRSLGVHISRVKSVNLDTWTGDQLSNLCSRGNGWAKDYYEATLPKGFKRPQSDSSMEYFIRDKYEKRKYCSASEIPLRSIDEYSIFMNSPSPNVKHREKKKELGNGIPIIGSIKSVEKPVEDKPAPALIMTKPVKQQTPATIAATPQVNSAMDDLLGLNTPIAAPATTANPPNQFQPSNDLTSDLFACMQSNATAPSTKNANQPSATETQPSTAASKQMSKDSILSLYSQNQPMSMQHNPYLSAGPYNITGQPASIYPSNMAAMSSMGNYQQINMQQGATTIQQQPMQGYPQQQQFNWQQQQMQQQMQNMHLGGVNSNLQFGGLRTCSSMPQMSHQQVGAAFGGQMQQGTAVGGLLSAPAYGGLTSSQPSLTGLDSNLGSWNTSQANSGQTLSNQLWK